MCYDLLRFSSWFGDLCEMEAWTTSVASDSILPFHLPPPYPHKGRLRKLNRRIGNPPAQLRCERCCSPTACRRSWLRRPSPSPPRSRQRRPSKVGSTEPICWTSLPFFVKSRTCALAAGCALWHPPGAAHTYHPIPPTTRQSALMSPSVACVC